MKGQISISNVTKTFRTPILKEGFRGSIQNLFHRDYQSITAVDDISLEITPGEVVGYIGPNGAGKTTTIKMLSGILHPTNGKILVNGLVPFESRKDHAMQIGAMFGNQTRLYWNLPVQESFSLLRKIYSVDYTVYKKRIKTLAGMLQIEDLLPRQTRTLSLGQRIRCELAASLIHSPAVIYLDEPTIGLDVSVKSRVLDFLNEVNHQENKTIILTSHDVHDIETLASRITVIDTGKILFDGGIDNFKTQFGSGQKIVMAQFDQEIPETAMEKMRSDGDILVNDFDGFNLQITLEKGVQPAKALQAITGLGHVQDVTVTSEPVVDMVRRIYEK